MVATARLAAGLAGLRPKALQTLQSRAPCPVATYRAILSEVASCDLENTLAEPTRRKFNAYYGVRRNAAWRSTFYARFEAAKGSTVGSRELFAEVVGDIFDTTGRVEASFASKLVATLRPDSPIVDSVLRGWLSRHLDAPRFGGGVAAAVDYYVWLAEVMVELAASSQALAWIEVFQEAFPPAVREAPVAAMKQLDFLIWGGADR